MELSCSDIMIPGKNWTEKAEKLIQWGYKGMSVFTDYSDWSDSKHQELLQLSQKTGITVGEFVFMDDLYGHLMDCDLKIRKATREMYKNALRICSEIGAISEMEFDYGPQNPLPLFEPYKKMQSDEEKEFVELIEELSEVVVGSSAQILIEPINRYETRYLTTIDDCVDVLMKAKKPNTGILADLFHLSIEEGNLPGSIRKAKGFIKHVHLGDSNRLLPGQGHIDWVECIRALKIAEFDGFLNLECAVLGDPEIELPKTAQFLKNILSAN